MVGVGGAAAIPGKAISSASAAQRSTEGVAVTRPAETEDVTLVRRTQAGDQEAFAALVEKYKDSVFNVAYRMLGNGSEAEDVAQEAFVRAYTQLHTYKDTHRFSTWLLSIASHLAIDQLRRRRFLALPLENVPFLEWIADLSLGPEESALALEASDEMQKVLSVLPPKYRAVLVLRYWHDLSYEEIAEALHLTAPLVKARLHRARELVARQMKAQGLEFRLGEDVERGKAPAAPEGSLRAVAQ